MSQETLCFSATVLWEGKPVGQVINHGHGGSNQYHWETRKIGDTIEAWAKEQPLEFEFEKLDILIDQCLNHLENTKRFQRLFKKELLFRLKGDKKHEWRSFKIKTPDYLDRLVSHVRQKYGDKLECIGNEIGAEAALTY